MNLIKILYWFIGIHVLAQPLQCKDGDYYCNDVGKCITKGVLCKTSCDICLDKQKIQNIACINECNNEVDHLINNNCSPGFYDHDNNKSTPCISTPDCLEYTKCNDEYEVIKTDNVCSCQLKKTCDRRYVCPYIKEIKGDMLNGYTTYEVSLVLKEDYSNGNIYAIYGDHGHPMTIPPAYQIEQHIGVDIGGTNPIINNNVPEGNYDSWLTIGIHDSNILGKISSIGIDFDDWDEYHGIIVDDGAVFLIDPTVKLSKTNKYIIGHLTLKNTEDHTLNINVQGLMDVILKYNSNNYVENNILYNFKKKNEKNVGH